MGIITPTIGPNSLKKLTQHNRGRVLIFKLGRCESMHACCFSFKLCHGYCVSFMELCGSIAGAIIPVTHHFSGELPVIVLIVSVRKGRLKVIVALLLLVLQLNN